MQAYRLRVLLYLGLWANGIVGLSAKITVRPCATGILGLRATGSLGLWAKDTVGL